MSPVTIVIVSLLALLAILAWAAAWQTLHWLGDAEDMIDWCADGQGPGSQTLTQYKRRTPRRGR